jgi:hypothetical protein
METGDWIFRSELHEVSNSIKIIQLYCYVACGIFTADMPILKTRATQKPVVGDDKHSTCRLLVMVSCLTYYSTLKMEVMLFRNVGLSLSYTALQSRRMYSSSS